MSKRIVRAHITLTSFYSGVVTARFGSDKESICEMTYFQAGDDFVIYDIVFNSELSKEDITLVGDACDDALTAAAKKRGVKNLYMALKVRDAEWVKSYEDVKAPTTFQHVKELPPITRVSYQN